MGEKEKEEAKKGPKLTVKAADGKEKEVTANEIRKTQKLRRRASQVAVSSHLTSESGRRLSALEKNLYVVDKAIELANQEEEEDAKLGLGVEDEKEVEEPKDKNWKFLPYEPVQGDPVDELLAEQLNIFEIDVDIRPLKLKNKKKKKGKREKGGKGIFYRIQGKKKRVRFIHGVLLLREGGKGGEWIELVPYLRKLAGLP